ncbi:Ferric reductase, NADH/NADPH oxidase transmembrane component (5 domains) [Scheffersomyces stipitis CBS 6054]|uniref:ferric-chelate reductase (NADPH) n=1 Tax=Scheffersomyces stipitis (strain ATCC 58785 / CBS 6054 / NBRC 10063 / NRRL Y-11545) TaxID=322104 RepID=A3M0N7_PICST|nr:Ferric reductase, NADH/NADPH oxidase transmembrane component (5 domains) [Scheffersomyces stipitis CBS 6054]ABN68735.2 Ferric reductase, NADH/NADPH oxidase transmembrane component (5 domains) [Scheffersomyces stipitis CBS 6054]
MTSSIPFDQQFFVEKERGTRYQWLNYLFCILVFIFHGIVFYWIPRFLRSKRDVKFMKYKPVFIFFNMWDSLNHCFKLDIPFFGWTYHYQPSVLLLFLMFIIVNVRFCYIDTIDIDYLPRMYVIGKRIGKVALGNLPIIYLLVTKNDLVASITGLKPERLVFLHFWFARLLFTMITVHMIMTIKYWLDSNFIVMLQIPPQIFGFMSYGSLFLLTFANIKIIRRYAFDFFMVQHRIFSFIMLLLAFFHNGGSKAMVILAVHLLVLDKVIGRIISIIHKVKSPTKGMSEFEILDEKTLRVTIPVKLSSQNADVWYNQFVPKYGSWKAGQHVLLTVGKVSRFQQHPFTIASLSETGKIQLIIRVKNGFTKKLMKKTSQNSSIVEDTASTESDNPEIVKLKASFYGPYGGRFHPLITFDSIVFMAAGSGASFVFPVCLDLLKNIESREIERDYLYRPSNPTVRVTWSIKKFKNIDWYSAQLKMLMPYVNSGKLMLDIYITQESSEKVTIVKESKSTAATSSSSSVFSNNCQVFYNTRPNIPQIIEYHVNSLKYPEENFYKSLAVAACGPHSFNYTAKLECQKHKWTKDCPNIYFYDESFD